MAEKDPASALTKFACDYDDCRTPEFRSAVRQFKVSE
ncbi:Uncharacterised protein [Vibrio cholerae]|nr:Uncharacterised protein [Vibrio cholerae]